MGSLYPGKWEIYEDVSLDFVLNVKPKSYTEKLPLEDVWVDLGQAIKILSDDGRNIATINKIWTVHSNAYCPMLDFMLQTTQKTNKKSNLFKKCIESLVSLALAPRDKESLEKNSIKFSNPELPEQLELDAQFLDSEDLSTELLALDEGGEESPLKSATSPLKRSKRTSKKKLPEDFLDLENYAQEPEVLMRYECENLKKECNESKMDFDTDLYDEVDQSLDQDDQDDHVSDEGDQIERRLESVPVIQCQLCPETCRGDVRLFSHYIAQHPDEPSLHPPRPNVTLFECSHCPEVFERRTSLIRHKRSKHPTKKLGRKKMKTGLKMNCQGCNKKFVTQAGLYRHCVDHHPDAPEVWPSKPQGKSGVRLLDLHERSELRCGLPECGHTFLHFKGLARHERTHTEAFICILCGQPLYSSENLISHSDSVHPTKSEFLCRVCGFYCYTELSLKLHTVQVHMKGTKEYACSECEFKTHNQSTFQAHIRVHKNYEKNYICDECGKECNTQTALSTHKRTHQSSETFHYQCNFCPKRFPHVSLLNIHERVHTGEKPYQCKDCGQCFGSQSSLIKHNRNIHTPEDLMPYKCGECGKTFSKARRKVYFGHLKQHSGIRDHVCPVCKAAFSSRGYLGNHFKKVHKRKLHEVEEELKIKTDPLNAEHISFTIIA